MYAVWFMGFMLAWATILWDMQASDFPITEQASLKAAMLSVGSWVTLLIVVLSILARRHGDGEYGD